MCDTKGHEHWCSVCSKNLNKVPAGSYVEVEWRQNEKGQIVEEKSMICKECVKEAENVRELTKFFKDLEYPPWGHVFCSVCRKDLTKELGRDIEPGKDYECLNFKCHERSGPNIKHIVRVVVLCQNCVKKEFNAENLEKLKKLGKNPIFKPKVECPNTQECRQFKQGDENVNCKHIVIGRDRETLHFGLLCGRKHKGSVILPFDDGFSISRPRKGKGAAAASPPSIVAAPGVNPVQDAMREIEKMMKKFKLGKFADPLPDHSGKFLNIEARLLNIERILNINGSYVSTVACSVSDIKPVPNIPEDVEEDVQRDIVVEMPAPIASADNKKMIHKKR